MQLVTFPDTGWSAVKIVRGGLPARDKTGQEPAAEKTEAAEIVTFADSDGMPVRILRGDSERSLGMSAQLGSAAAMTMQVVTFANLQDRPVSILRGPGFQVAAETELFGSNQVRHRMHQKPFDRPPQMPRSVSGIRTLIEHEAFRRRRQS